MLTRLPHRVVVQNEIRTEFEGGAYTSSWTTDSTEWANVQFDDKSKETYSQEKNQQMTYVNVIMRQDVNLTNRNRLLFNNNILVIEDEGDPTYRNRMKKIKCRLEQQTTATEEVTYVLFVPSGSDCLVTRDSKTFKIKEAS